MKRCECGILRKRLKQLEFECAQLGAKWSEYVETLLNLTDALGGTTPKRLKKGKQFNNAYIQALTLLDGGMRKESDNGKDS